MPGSICTNPWKLCTVTPLCWAAFSFSTGPGTPDVLAAAAPAAAAPGMQIAAAASTATARAPRRGFQPVTRMAASTSRPPRQARATPQGGRIILKDERAPPKVANRAYPGPAG